MTRNEAHVANEQGKGGNFESKCSVRMGGGAGMN